MHHQIHEWNFGDRWPALTPRWRCSCGEEFSREQDAVAHAAVAPVVMIVVESPPAPAPPDPTPTLPAWPFPSVSYDYAHARVGAVHRVIEVDHAEVTRVLKNFKCAPPPSQNETPVDQRDS